MKNEYKFNEVFESMEIVKDGFIYSCGTGDSKNHILGYIMNQETKKFEEFEAFNNDGVCLYILPKSMAFCQTKACQARVLMKRLYRALCLPVDVKKDQVVYKID